MGVGAWDEQDVEERLDVSINISPRERILARCLFLRSMQRLKALKIPQVFTTSSLRVRREIAHIHSASTVARMHANPYLSLYNLALEASYHSLDILSVACGISKLCQLARGRDD